MGLEAYRQTVNGMEAGCIELSKKDIAVVGLSSMFGNLIGGADAGQVADDKGEGMHWNQEPSDVRAATVGGSAGGIMTSPFSALEGSEGDQ